MDNVSVGGSKLRLLIGVFFLLGIFVFALGVGLYFFDSFGHKSGGVRVISATNYDEFEIKGDSVLGDSTGALIDINTASQVQLEVLPGIGPVTAGKIIAGRPYSTLEELLIKKTVGRSLYEKISSQITLGE